MPEENHTFETFSYISHPQNSRRSAISFLQIFLFQNVDWPVFGPVGIIFSHNCEAPHNACQLFLILILLILKCHYRTHRRTKALFRAMPIAHAAKLPSLSNLWNCSHKMLAVSCRRSSASLWLWTSINRYEYNLFWAWLYKRKNRTLLISFTFLISLTSTQNLDSLLWKKVIIWHEKH